MLYKGCILLLGLVCCVVITWIELEEFSTIEGMGMYVWFVCGVQLLCVSLLEDVGGKGCKSGALLERVISPGVALGIGLGVDLNLHFLRKRWFLSVILPDPSTLI